MKITNTYCDPCLEAKCGKRTAKSYRYATGCEMDPSGNGYNTTWNYIDLCPECYTRKIKTHALREV